MRRLIAIALLGSVLAACGGGNNTPPGQRPAATETATAPSAPATTPGGASTRSPSPSPTPAANPQTYTVVAGDTLWDIAARFNTTVQAIAELNELDDEDALSIGQVLKLPGASPAPSTSASPSASSSPSATPTQ